MCRSIMHRRASRRRSEPNPEKEKSKEALKLAFRHEVRPEDYLLRVWGTSILASFYYSYMACTRNGNFDLSFILPLNAKWSGHDPYGNLYLETWSTILVDSLQVGFVIWGSTLLITGIYRAFKKDKYIFACFYLGIAFIGFFMFLPSWTQSLLNMLIEKCPVLVQ